MGYDLHISRAEDWSDSEDKPITMQEWVAFVESDPEFEMTQHASGANPRTGEIIRIESQGLARWTHRGASVWFSYRQGRIVVKNPDDEVIKKMKMVASQFGARVYGDEREAY